MRIVVRNIVGVPVHLLYLVALSCCYIGQNPTNLILSSNPQMADYTDDVTISPYRSPNLTSMKSVTTKRRKSTESISDEPSVMQAPKSDTLDPMMALNEETMPSDNLQDSVARPSFRKSVRLATHELNIAPKLAVAALTEGDSLAMRTLRKRIRGFFGDDPQTSDAKGIEAIKSQVELEFRELKSGNEFWM